MEDRKIDKYKLKVASSICELENTLDPNKRCWVRQEVEIYSTEYRDNQDETYDCVFRSKLVGGTEVEQKGEKKVLGKSKRSPSQRLRMALLQVNPDEAYYEVFVGKIIASLIENPDKLLSYLKEF